MNWNIIGHEWAVKLLKQQIVQNKYRHAYLITGPESVGRRTLALRFAQALNCPQPLESGEPCFTCSTCEKIEDLVHPDLTVTQAEIAGGQLKVDQIRELQHGLALAPYEAKFRIALILRFEEANPHAANALLKTLEEPPSQVIMILTAESAEKLMPTIVSRCEVLRLRPLANPDVNNGIQSVWKIPPEQANLLAHVSGGRPGYAFRLYQEPDLLAIRNASLDDLQDLLSSNRVERFEYAESMAKNPETFRETLKVWLSFWRDVMLRASTSSAQITNIDRAESIDKLAHQLESNTAHNLVASLERIFDQLDHNVNPRLALEVFMLDLPYLGRFFT
jgi:DNA polymerase-3 subunit delta'